MRILVGHPGPQFSVHDVYVGWVEALRELGLRVIEFNLADRLTFYDSVFMATGPVADSDEQVHIRKALNHEQAAELALNGLYAALYKTKPDVLLMVSGFFVEPEMLNLARSYGTKVVLLHTESPYEDERQLKLAAHADLNLLNDPINIDRYAAVAPARYVPHAYRPSVHRPGPIDPELVCDFAFIGTAYASRIRFLEAMNLDGLNVFLAGNWQLLDDDSPLLRHVAHGVEECLDNRQTVQVYRSARVGMNLYRREAERPGLADGLAMGPREVEMAATGLFFLRDPRPEGDQVLSMLPTFTSPKEASEQLRWWLERPDERAELAAQARQAVADRTFLTHAKDVLRALEGTPR